MMTEAMRNLIYQDCKISCKEPQLFAELKEKTLLITGGTGYIGKWIAEMVNYINDVEPYNIKLYLLSRDVQKFKDEMPHLAVKPFIRFIEQDVKNVHDLPQDINFIIHAAGSPDNRDHVSQPIRTVETFAKGTQAVLDAATRLSELHKLIHISSHQVYGKNENDTLIEEKYVGPVEFTGINNIYPEVKRYTETLCSIYRHQFKLPIVVLRPFAFVGPYHDLEKPWAINNFIRDGILGGPIRILGNGSTIRSYLYASDMAYWILKTLIKSEPGKNYNLGSKQAISLDDLAEKVKNSLGGNVEVLSKSAKQTYLTLSKLVPDITKIAKEIGVMESFTIDEAVNKTIAWNQLNRK